MLENVRSVDLCRSSMNSVHALLNLKFQLCSVYELASLVEEPKRILLGSNYSFNLIELKYCVNLETVEYTLIKFRKKNVFCYIVIVKKRFHIPRFIQIVVICSIIIENENVTNFVTDFPNSHAICG